MSMPFHVRPDGGFLPQEYVERRTEAKFYIIVFFVFIVVMTGVAGAFLVTQQRWTEVRRAQVDISKVFEQEQVKLEQLRALEAQRASMLEKARVTSALLEPIPRSVLMAELVSRLPATATLFDVKLESERVREAPVAPRTGEKPATGTLTGGVPAAAKPPVRVPKFTYKLTIDGVSTDNKLVADYLESLHQSPLLKDVELQFIETKTINSEAYRGFRMTAELREDADARAVAKAQEVERDVVASAVEEGN